MRTWRLTGRHRLTLSQELRHRPPVGVWRDAFTVSAQTDCTFQSALVGWIPEHIHIRRYMIITHGFNSDPVDDSAEFRIEGTWTKIWHGFSKGEPAGLEFLA